jgi:uncharacterized protein (DUF2267 family)
MEYDGFIELVEQAAHVDRDTAEQAARATLQTLGERIAMGEARDLALQGPPEVSPWIATTTGAEGFGVDEFVRRVAAREGVAPDIAERHATGVFTALGQTVSFDEIDDTVAELPTEFKRLMPRWPAGPAGNVVRGTYRP